MGRSTFSAMATSTRIDIDRQRHIDEGPLLTPSESGVQDEGGALRPKALVSSRSGRRLIAEAVARRPGRMEEPARSWAIPLELK